MNRFSPWCFGVAGFCGALHAGAQTQPSSVAPAPSTAYRHDGIYARAGLGVSTASFWGDGPDGAAFWSGWGPAFSLAVGGTPWDGVALGATFEFAGATGTFHGAPATTPGDATGVAPLLGAFVDWFPNPTGQWHAGGEVGFGGYSFSDPASRRYVGYAPGVGAFGGYDGWIASQFSLGIELFGTLAARAPSTDKLHRSTGYHFASAAVGLETTLLWH